MTCGLVHVAILRPGSAPPLPRCTPLWYHQVLFTHAHTNKDTPAHTAHTAHRRCPHSSDSLATPHSRTLRHNAARHTLRHAMPMRYRYTEATQRERCAHTARHSAGSGPGKAWFKPARQRTAGHAVWSVVDKSDRSKADAHQKQQPAALWRLVPSSAYKTPMRRHHSASLAFLGHTTRYAAQRIVCVSWPLLHALSVTPCASESK